MSLRVLSVLALGSGFALAFAGTGASASATTVSSVGGSSHQSVSPRPYPPARTLDAVRGTNLARAVAAPVPGPSGTGTPSAAPAPVASGRVVAKPAPTSTNSTSGVPKPTSTSRTAAPKPPAPKSPAPKSAAPKDPAPVAPPAPPVATQKPAPTPVCPTGTVDYRFGAPTIRANIGGVPVKQVGWDVYVPVTFTNSTTLPVWISEARVRIVSSSGRGVKDVEVQFAPTQLDPHATVTGTASAFVGLADSVGPPSAAFSPGQTPNFLRDSPRGCANSATQTYG